jgi:hypothetical protein
MPRALGGTIGAKAAREKPSRGGVSSVTEDTNRSYGPSAWISSKFFK